MTRSSLRLLAVACGVAVGNVYFPQAVSPSIAAGLHVGTGAAALVVTAAQLGYATGILLLVPLGDRLPHRRLIVSLLALTGLGLLAASAAPGLPVLLGASALVGLATVVAPIIGPMAAGAVPADRRGVVSGTLLSGSLGGMLLSRTLGGALGDRLGWRAPYVLAAVLTLAVALLLARALPATRPPSDRGHAAPLRLLRTEPELRRSCWYQATVFAGFSAVWTSVALLLTGPKYGLSIRAVGLLALVNAGTMLCTPVAGRLADRRGPDLVNLVSMLGVLASALVLAGGGRGGVSGLVALVAGSLLLDVAMQSGMVANQVRNYALRPDARSRVNTAYMTCGYLGGGAGSWLGARVYGRMGWPGVCGLVALLAVAALTRHLGPNLSGRAGRPGRARSRRRRSTARATPAGARRAGP
jgi:predicted MFS family arabinose efflux permease